MDKKDKRHKGVTARVASKSPIAPPPRAALHGRASKTDHPNHGAATELTIVGGKEGEGAKPQSGLDAAVTTTDPRDEQIRQLEADLKEMEEEFNKELNTLSYKLTGEQEKVAYWEQRYAVLNEQFLKIDADLRLLQDELTSHEMRQEEQDRELQTRISSLLLERDALRKENLVLRADARDKTQDIIQLRNQVRGLKDFVSTNTRTDGQVTDEQFSDMVQKLGNVLQNWVITNFRRAKLELGRATEDIRTHVARYVPQDEVLAATGKIYLLQSILSHILADEVFDAYFVGLPAEQALHLQASEAYLRSIGPTDSVNQWRSSTLSFLRKDTAALQVQTDAVKEGIVNQVNHIMDGITDTAHTDSRDQSLGSLIVSAIELARLMKVQRAVFTLIMPPADDADYVFDPTQMEDVGGEDEEMLQGRRIRCVAFPGVVKQGDENGEQTQLRNVIAKARVICHI